MIRYQGNKVKKYFYFLLVILFTANVFGCTKQIGNDSVTDRKIQEDGKESIYKRLYHIGEALCKYVPKEYRRDLMIPVLHIQHMRMKPMHGSIQRIV